MLTVICGPMFSGKSTELMRRVRRAQVAGEIVDVWKPHADTRQRGVRSHDGMELDSDSCQSFAHVMERATQHDLIAVDEVQFFPDVVDWVDRLLELTATGMIDVVVAGLDLDFRGKPFEGTKELMAVADDVVKLKAVCTARGRSPRVICGRDAGRTQRLRDGLPVTSGERIQVGGLETYEARCPACFITGGETHEHDAVLEHARG